MSCQVGGNTKKSPTWPLAHKVYYRTIIIIWFFHSEGRRKIASRLLENSFWIETILFWVKNRDFVITSFHRFFSFQFAQFYCHCVFVGGLFKTAITQNLKCRKLIQYSVANSNSSVANSTFSTDIFSLRHFSTRHICWTFHSTFHPLKM